MKDSFFETRSKYQKWTNETAIASQPNTWNLLRIVLSSKYAEACKKTIHLHSPNRDQYPNMESFWSTGIFELDNETLLFILKKNIEEYIPLLQKQCDNAMYNLIMSNKYSLEKISKMKEKIIVNDEGYSIHLFIE